jgi:SAM-dependent methyltransferase
MSDAPVKDRQSGDDRWARWVLHARHGGDDAVRTSVEAQLAVVRDAVLSHAHIAPGETVLDIGTGDGLIGVGALPLVAPGGQVIFSDVSAPLLEHVRATLGDGPHRFVHARAEDLSEIESGSVDIVTVRSVLIYVHEKRKAFEEISRVLAPGGRLSLCEPINVRMCDPDRYGAYDITPIGEIVARLSEPAQDTEHPDPMTDFDETTLLSLAEDVGFTDLHLHLQVDVRQTVEPMPWEAFTHSAMNPNAPTLAEAMRRALRDDEQQRLERHLRPLVEGGIGVHRVALAFLWGRR